MFFQQNQDFLNSFGAEVQQPQQLQNQSPNQKIQLPVVCNSSKKNSKDDTPLNKSSLNQSQRQSLSENQPVAELNTSKKLNNIITTSNKSRRFSEQCSQLKIRNFKKAEDDDVKSEKSLDEDCFQKIQDQNNIEKSNRSISSKSYKFNITEFQGSLMKKIRNLQARIKNIDLNYKNIIMKLKHQNTKLQKQHHLFKNFLTSKYPHIIHQINDSIQQQQDDSDQMFSSSDSQKQNDEIMPIMSKIQQIRFDGQKLSEMIKNYQQIQIKKEQIIQALLKQKQQQMEATDLKRKGTSRKYSIPEEYRKKKFSFNSTMVTQLKDKIAKKPKQQSNSQKDQPPGPIMKHHEADGQVEIK